MPPFVLALLGSPRLKGATAQLLRSFCRSFAGYNYISLHLPALSLLPCQGCFYCQKHTHCKQPDDASRLFQLLHDASAIVVAAPVYFYGFPGQTKVVIDRCHPLWHSSVWQKQPQRPGFFISACGTASRTEFEVIRHEAKAFFNTIALDYSGEFLLPGLTAPHIQQRLALAKSRIAQKGKLFYRRYLWKKI